MMSSLLPLSLCSRAWHINIQLFKRGLGRINSGRSDPTMKGIIFGDSCNKFLNFIAGTGTSVAIIPQSLAERNKLNIVPTDPDEPKYEGVIGMRLTVVGQTEMLINFKTTRNTKFSGP